MWTSTDYHFDRADWSDGAATFDREFAAVWRVNFQAPGFCVLDLGSAVGSHMLRSRMLDLKERLSEIASQRGGVGFAYRSVGRFDQQVTTRFHLDGAPAESLLMLGYEPSPIPSRLAMADYTRCAHGRQIEPQRFLDEFNPMFRQGADMLARYVTVLPAPAPGHSQIVLVNNSSLPFDSTELNPLGVLHQAEILTPDESQRRIINSIMLMAGEMDEVGIESLRTFVATDAMSGRY